jgi:hypothetical protein
VFFVPRVLPRLPGLAVLGLDRAHPSELVGKWLCGYSTDKDSITVMLADGTGSWYDGSAFTWKVQDGGLYFFTQNSVKYSPGFWIFSPSISGGDTSMYEYPRYSVSANGLKLHLIQRNGYEDTWTKATAAEVKARADAEAIVEAKKAAKARSEAEAERKKEKNQCNEPCRHGIGLQA